VTAAGREGVKVARTREEQLAYARGYSRGSQGRWPDHRPPLPPEPVVNRLLETAQALRDGFDSLCAVSDPDDEVVKILAPVIDDFDAAMAAMTDWLRQRSPAGEPGGPADGR
jgi:hypothetical protein